VLILSLHDRNEVSSIKLPNGESMAIITAEEMEKILNSIKDANDPLAGLHTTIMQATISAPPPKTRREKYVDRKLEAGNTNEW
jgi:hypothetical protein